MSIPCCTGEGKMRTGKVKALFLDRAGSMTVEFVAVIPVLLAALAFSFEFGRALWAYDVMTRDVRAGVRYLSRAVNSVAAPNCPAAATTFVTNGISGSAHFPW